MAESDGPRSSPGDVGAIRRLFLVVCALGLLSACGGDGADLPAIRAEDVPSGEPVSGPTDRPELTDGCITAGDTTLVFVEGQASIESVGNDPDSGAEMRTLELRYQTSDGAGVLASVGLDVPDAAIEGDPDEFESWPGSGPLGYPVEPSEWAEQPSDDCDGPYFVVTAIEAPGRP